jgi:hypothetical protein
VPSYSPVFSAQFIAYTNDSPNAQFEVPEGFTAVVRDITLWVSAGGRYATVGFQNSSIAPTVWFAWLQQETLGGSSQWTGRVVVPGGGFINLDTDGITLSDAVYVGGYLLRNNLT